MSETSNVVPFPRQLRVGSSDPDVAAATAPATEDQTLVEHDGRLYAVRALLHPLLAEKLQAVDATAPKSWQAFWDEVVGRWPALAAEIVRVAVPVPLPR